MIDHVQLASEIADTTCKRTVARLADVASQSEIAEFLAVADDVRPYDSYKVFSPAAHSLLAKIKARAGVTACRSFLCSVIAQGVVNTLGSDRFRDLPVRVAIQQARQLRRIAENTNEEADWLDPDNDLFQKELGLATMRLYAAGAQLLEIHSGVPRSLIFRSGAFGALATLGSMLRMGGFRPYFQIHTHQFMLDAFNESGWEECYRCCSELYAVHPEVLGMHGASWFYDPALSVVSPRLGYLRGTPVDGGARLFFYEEGGSSISNSLSTSPTRRKLYDEGKYLPKSYMLVWGRREQIAWARRSLPVQTA